MSPILQVYAWTEASAGMTDRYSSVRNGSSCYRTWNFSHTLYTSRSPNFRMQSAGFAQRAQLIHGALSSVCSMPILCRKKSYRLLRQFWVDRFRARPYLIYQIRKSQGPSLSSNSSCVIKTGNPMARDFWIHGLS